MAIINTVAGRDKLKPRREPYWLKLSAGNYLGFRRQSASSAGTWVTRWRDDIGGQKYRALGAFDEPPPNSRFDAATRAAQEWLQHVNAGDRADGVRAVHRSNCPREGRKRCGRRAAQLKTVCV